MRCQIGKSPLTTKHKHPRKTINTTTASHSFHLILQSSFFAPEYKVEFTAAQEKRFPNTASYKSTTSYLRYLQPQHQTATKYDTMVVAVKKKQCQSKNRQLQTTGQTRHSSMQMSFVRRSKVGHRVKASYYSDERPSLEKARLKPQSPDLQ